MFDLHSHILPGVDDGAATLDMALAMARGSAAQGISVIACTPHVLPGLYPNTGPSIRAAVTQLQRAIDDAAIPIRLVTGAENHVQPDMLHGLATGRLLAINDTRYVLIELPHNALPPRVDAEIHTLLASGYIPILAHPERQAWIRTRFDVIRDLHARGVLMQITARSLLGGFGYDAQHWAERMLGGELVDLIGSDAHDLVRRPFNLAAGHARAVTLVGHETADALVIHRPRAILENAEPMRRPHPLFEEASHVPRLHDLADHVGGGLAQRV
jgi:protein-tyrosine phosphatase